MLGRGDRGPLLLQISSSLMPRPRSSLRRPAVAAVAAIATLGAHQSHKAISGNFVGAGAGSSAFAANPRFVVVRAKGGEAASDSAAVTESTAGAAARKTQVATFAMG